MTIRAVSIRTALGFGALAIARSASPADAQPATIAEWPAVGLAGFVASHTGYPTPTEADLDCLTSAAGAVWCAGPIG